MRKFIAKNFIGVLIITGLLLSCVEKPDPAIPALYFVQFYDSINNQLTKKIVENVPNILESYDYVLTEESGNQGWPFYLKIPKGSSFPKDSLAPPHTTVHILEVGEELDPVENGENYNMEIKFFSVSDSLLELQTEILKYETGERVIQREYKFYLGRYESDEELFNRISDTIIRNTFK